MQSLTFFVEGTPVPQGSKDAFITGQTKLVHDGKVYRVGGFATLAETTRARLKPWRSKIAFVALSALAGRPWDKAAPMQLGVTFKFRRPNSHFGSRDKRPYLFEDSPERYVKDPDWDKLARAVSDALTGALWNDDCQVYDGHVRKLYCLEGEVEGAQITVTGD